MIKLIINYILIGILINAMYDMLINWISKFDEENESHRFTMTERFVFGILWPFSIFMIVFVFIKNIFSNDK